MLTNGNLHGLDILKGLKDNGIAIDVVFETLPQVTDHLAKHSSDILPVCYLKAAKKWWARRQYVAQTAPAFAQLAEHFYYTGPLNSKGMVKQLNQLKPDYLILGGIGILKAEVIETASKGVINTHPGLLPWARGSGVVGRSIEADIACGGTCHYVNTGIDKGDFIERRLLPLDGSEKSLSEVEQKAHYLVVQMMVDKVTEIVQTQQKPERVEQLTQFKMFKSVMAEQRPAIDNMVAQGKAQALFERWREKTSGVEPFVLPAQIQE